MDKTSWWVNGVAMPSPSTDGYKWSLMDIHAPNAGRTLDAVMHFTIVARKRKLELTFPAGDPTIHSTIMQATNDATFTVKYWDLHDNNWRTSTMYKGDRKGGLVIFSNERSVSDTFSINLIEV